MQNRKYTVEDIEKMRKKIDNHYLWGRYSGPDLSISKCDSDETSGQYRIGSFMSRQYNERDKETTVEERLRTHILASIGPEDLIDV